MFFQDLIEQGFLSEEKIRQVFLRVLRHDFVPKDLEEEAEKNIALPIGFGKQIIKPQRAAFLLENLDLEEGQKVLCLGSDSGWLPNLLKGVIGENGIVVSLDGISELTQLAQENSRRHGFLQAGKLRFITVPEEIGFPTEAPYDRIVSLVSFSQIPENLKKQLKVGGKALFLISNHYIFLERKATTHFWEDSEIELGALKKRAGKNLYKH